jgi:hypothetical protein
MLYYSQHSTPQSLLDMNADHFSESNEPMRIYIECASSLYSIVGRIRAVQTILELFFV